MNSQLPPASNPPPLFPLFADLRGRQVLVAGGGQVAERKIAALLEAGADVSVVAPALTPTLLAYVALGRVRQRAHTFDQSQLDGVWLVIAASADATVNRAVATAAQACGVFANVVDDAAQSSVHVPARITRGALQVAISTGGAAPVLARRLRARFEAELDASLSALTQLFARERARIRWRLPQPGKRRRFFARVLDGDVPQLLRAGDDAAAKASFERTLATGVAGVRRGRVTLVGAGPGNPELLTLAALRALQEADVIVHDRLVGAGILDLARRDAERIDVGKHAGEDHAATQARIHALLLQHARAGRDVVRLQGGDPLVFGRGGEELDFLRAHAIPVTVVPGITAALAAAAAAGIALTDRRHAHGLTLLSARSAIDTGDAAFALPGHTLAVYMGVGEAEVLAVSLRRAGHADDTPCAVVENASLPNQRVFHTILIALPDLARAQALAPPALLIIGEVAAQAKRALRAERCHDGLMRVTTRAA